MKKVKKKKKQSPVATQQGHSLAREIGAVKYMECSALPREGIYAVFDEAVRSVDSPKPKKKNVWQCVKFVFGSCDFCLAFLALYLLIILICY